VTEEGTRNFYRRWMELMTLDPDSPQPPAGAPSGAE
jgi:hypothetical protein